MNDPPGVFNAYAGRGAVASNAGGASPWPLDHRLSAIQVSVDSGARAIFGGPIGNGAAGSRTGAGGTTARAVAASSASQSVARDLCWRWLVAQPAATTTS